MSTSVESVLSVVIWTALLTALVVAATILVRRFRGSDVDGEVSASELLTKFREVHSQGGLSDQEFRTIKAQLTERLQTELEHAKIDSRAR